jgi:hypothetical protein
MLMTTRIHRTGSHQGQWAYFCCRLVDAWYPRLRDDRELCDTHVLYLADSQFATTPFKGPNRNATFANVLKNEVTFPDSAPVTRSAAASTVLHLRPKLTCQLLQVRHPQAVD